jgi:hypothetical protein
MQQAVIGRLTAENACQFHAGGTFGGGNGRLTVEVAVACAIQREKSFDAKTRLRISAAGSHSPLRGSLMPANRLKLWFSLLGVLLTY